MLAKLLLAVALLAFLFVLFFPRAIPRLLRRFGRSIRDGKLIGTEIVTGEEVENSPLARLEVPAGETVAMKLLMDYPAVADAELQKEIAGIGARLAQFARRKGIPYRFTVVESAEPNAFAVPGGSVFITRSLIELCDHEIDCIAAVLGHEIIHIDRRHAIQKLARSLAVKGGIRLFTFGRGAILARVAGGMQELLVKGYSQDRELEADLFGSRLAQSAGFDRRGMMRLLEHLQAENPDGTGPLAEVLGYFKSHPPIRTRIANLMREPSS